MGKRGTKPQPIAVIKDKGYYRPSRHKSEVDGSGALSFVEQKNLPMPPEHFDERLSEIWTKELFEIGRVYGWVGFVDLPMFEQWCIAYDECRKLAELCSKSDRVQYTEKGMSMNPVFKELREAQKLLTKLSAEFGLTPSSRTSIKLEQKEKEESKEPTYLI